jgi:hypothetical protein
LAILLLPFVCFCSTSMLNFPSLLSWSVKVPSL